MSHKGFQEYGNVFSFFFGKIRQNGLISRADKIMKRARWGLLISRLIARIIKYASVVIAFIETSAVTIVIATLLIVAIPIAAVTTGIVSLFSLISVSRRKEDLKRSLEGDGKIVFIYAQRGFDNKRHRFTSNMAKDLANSGYRVFVVSRPVFRDCLTVQKRSENLWIMKLNSFYIFKKRLMKNIDGSRLIYLS